MARAKQIDIFPVFGDKTIGYWKAIIEKLLEKFSKRKTLSCLISYGHGYGESKPIAIVNSKDVSKIFPSPPGVAYSAFKGNLGQWLETFEKLEKKYGSNSKMWVGDSTGHGHAMWFLG